MIFFLEWDLPSLHLDSFISASIDPAISWATLCASRSEIVSASTNTLTSSCRKSKGFRYLQRSSLQYFPFLEFFLMYSSAFILLAPGRTALIASAICTIFVSMHICGTQSWCHSIIFMSLSSSPYFRAIFPPISGWVPSMSWSIDFQRSWRSHPFNAKWSICSNKFCNRLSNIGNFFWVNQYILSITGSKSEFTNEWYNFIRNSDNPHLIEGFLPKIVDYFFFCFFLVFFNDFFDSCRLNSLIFNKSFKWFFCDISSKKIKAWYKDRIWRIIDNKRNPSCSFKCNNISSFLTNKFSLYIIGIKVNKCLSSLSSMISGVLLYGFYEYFLGEFCFSNSEFFLFFIKEQKYIFFKFFFRFFEGEVLLLLPHSFMK